MSNHDKVAHAWANKTGKHRKGFNMYYDGDTIYSYGRHFPIAKHVTNAHGESAVLCTTRGYSKSTAKHKTITWRAVSHLRVIECENPVAFGAREHAANYENLIMSAKRALERASRARTMKTWHIRDAATVLQHANAYAAFFDLPYPPVALESLDERAGAIVEAARQQEQAAILSRAKAERKATLENRERLRQWLKGENVRPPHTFRPMLRVKGDEVQTTWGASVPLSHALTVWRLFKAAHKYGKNAAMPSGASVGGFQITSIGPRALVVGCHTIPYRWALLAARCAGLEEA